jgi:hypothetical protein
MLVDLDRANALVARPLMRRLNVEMDADGPR